MADKNKNMTDTLPTLLRPAPSSKAHSDLPLDGEAAAAAVLSKLTSGTYAGTSEALAVLQREVESLTSGDPHELRRILARQAVLTDALANHFAAAAAHTSNPDAASTLSRTAVNAQQACIRTLVALAALSEKPVLPNP